MANKAMDPNKTVKVKEATYTIETERVDMESWSLTETEYLELVAHMIQELGKNWRRSPEVHDTARSWLYDNLDQPNKEFCGEGNGFSISKD